MNILKRLGAGIVAAHFLIASVQAQTPVTYPPLVSDVQAHQKAYSRTTANTSTTSRPVRAAKTSAPATGTARTSRYAKLLKQGKEKEGWKINSKVVTSLGFGLAAAIAIGLAAILGDDDDTSTSNTSTTTSTQ